MKVSIIIPCYNYSRYLHECFSNLQAMTYQDWEAIVIDDGSTDQTMEVVRSWQTKEPRIQYFYQQNQGVSKARNYGLNKSNGDLIQFLDADDLLSKEKLEVQVAYFKKFQEADLTYTENYYFQDGFSKTKFPDQEMLGREWMIRFSGEGAFAMEQLIRNNLAVVSSPMIRKDLAKKAGNFPESIAHTEDWQYWMQCVLAGARIQFIQNKNAYTLIRVHGKSVSQATQTMRYGELNLRTWLSETLSKNMLFSESETARLSAINEDRKKQLFKYIMYHGPLTSFGHLKKLAGMYDWPTVVSFYFKAINFRRKTINKTHAGNRHHHSL
jgi:glycosyltransferase involved in cell wall biosynthesis